MGNINNEKWTIETVNELFDKVLNIVEKQKDCTSISACVTELGYYENIIPYLKNKFSKEFKDGGFDSIKRAKDIIKSRLIDKGLNNEYNATMSIFILKTNHGMNEKVENINTNINLNSEPLTEQEVLERKKEIEERY